MDNCLIVDRGSVTGLRASGVDYKFTKEIAIDKLRSREFIAAFDINPIKALQNAKVEIEGLPSITNKPKAEFMGYKSGFDSKGKGSVEGDGKDKAMRKVANNAIVEIVKKDSSSATSLYEMYKKGWEESDNKMSKEDYISDELNGFEFAYNVDEFENTPQTIILARNSEFNRKSLQKATKEKIKEAHDNGATFVVGDMPGVDTQFIEYLIEIGAKFEVYHTDNKKYWTDKNQKENIGKSRIDVNNMIRISQRVNTTGIKQIEGTYDDFNNTQETIEEPPFSKSRESIQTKSIKQVLSDYDISFDSLPNEAKTRLTNNPELLDDSDLINALKCLK